MPSLSWERIQAMEGDENDVSLLPSQASLAMFMLLVLKDNPQNYIQEDVEDIGIDNINLFIDDTIARLSRV